MVRIEVVGIYTVIVVSVFWEISFNFVINGNTVFVTNWFYLGILDCGKRIGNNGKSGNSCGKPTGYFFVVESHLQSFIAVFIMHIVDDI